MKANIRRTGVVLLSILAVASVLGWAQSAVAPKGIITTPPDSELEVRIWVDKGAYAIGEAITIHYSVNQAAYVYIWDIQPDGVANQLFPYPTSQQPNNFVQAGEHILAPPPGSSGWIIAPPTGIEYLQILATTSPVQPFAYMTPDPQAFQQSIEAQVLGILPVEERSWDFTSFEIVEDTPEAYGIVTINSSPSGALITIDGQYAGYTPRTMFVEQGFHRLSVTKTGYTGWNAAIFTIGGLTRTINVTLEPIVAVNEPPVALFTYSPSAPGLGEWIQFDGTPSVDPDGTVASYSWNFGDGSTSYGATAWQRYMVPGVYTVTLIVTDDDGASDSISQTIQIGPTNQSPTAAFGFSPTNPAVNAWVQFDGSASSDPDGSIASYLWNFGDGSTGTGTVAWHRFSSPGTYQVILTVQDNDGATDMTTQTVQVGSTNLPPTAAFTFSPTNPAVNAWVQFDGSASSDADGSVASYAWDFGDGSSGTGAVAWHRFTASGTYLVTLTVVDNDGAQDATSQSVIVGTAQQPPVAAFTYSPTSPTVGQPILLNGQSSYDADGTIVSYSWDLNGDGSDDLSGSIGQVTYQSTGTVLVRLTVVDNDGLSSSSTQPITVSSAGGTPPSGGAPIGGTPPMGATPGIFVWGSDSWHITVNSGFGWTAPHAYRIELRTDGTFEEVAQPVVTSQGGPVSASPMGIITTPTAGQKTLIFEGSLQTDQVDHEFRIPDSQSMWLSLQLDIDGDGDLDTSPSFVYLRSSMVNPPSSPFVVGLPSGSSAELLPGLDFRIGNAISYTETTRFVYWTTTISNLEGP
jgi:PKD repeat protein